MRRMDDYVEQIAVAVASQLEPEFGSRTQIEVAAALSVRESSGGVAQYDPVAIGALIVAIAQLAWDVYKDHRKKEPETPREQTEQVLRTEIRREFRATPSTERITEVVIAEIVKRNSESP